MQNILQNAYQDGFFCWKHNNKELLKSSIISIPNKVKNWKQKKSMQHYQLYGHAKLEQNKQVSTYSFWQTFAAFITFCRVLLNESYSIDLIDFCKQTMKRMQ